MKGKINPVAKNLNRFNKSATHKDRKKAMKSGELKHKGAVLEKLSVSQGIGAWIDDFKKSDAPQFSGKSDKERRDMAIAAYLSAKRGVKESMQNISEAVSSPSLIESMKRLLGSASVLSTKAQNFHWNVQGPDFVQYHEFLGEYYSFVDGHIDRIAEQIRTLNVRAPGSLSEFTSLSVIDEDTNATNALQMLDELSQDNQRILSILETANILAEMLGNSGLANYLQDTIDQFNKKQWMLDAIQSRSIKESVSEAAYSAKAARAGKDIGKPGKMFNKIASKAAERYGSKERGEKVAGAILAKIRAKHMKEEVELDEAAFAPTMKKAIAAHERGDHKMAKYHLDNAKTARYAMKSTDIAKHKELLDKYEKLRDMHEEVEQIEEKEMRWMLPTGEKGKAYQARKASERQAQADKNDPGSKDKGMGPGVVDREKAAKKAREKGISKTASQVTMNYKRKLPEEVEQVREASQKVIDRIRKLSGGRNLSADEHRKLKIQAQAQLKREREAKKATPAPAKPVSKTSTGKTRVGSADPSDKHIVAQLRKAADYGPGHHDVRVSPTRSVKVHHTVVNKLLSAHDKLEKPEDKRRFRIGVIRKLRSQK